MSGRILLLLAMLFSQPALAVDTLDKIRKSGVITIAHPANTPPFSFMDGGEPGALGRTWIERADGSTTEMGSADTAQVEPGDVLVVETPGGGGFGPRP